MMLTATGRTYGSATGTIPTADAVLHNGVPWYVMLNDGRYKYIRPMVENDLEELYDLKRDPEELDNLAVKSEFSAKLKNFRRAAISELKRTNASFVDSMPAVREGA
jgi:hypothetical protein